MSTAGVIQRGAKPAVFLLCLTPAALTAYYFFTGGLSFNPIDDVTDISGRWTLRFLLITLAVTPVRKVTGFNVLARYRRMLGLFAFFYAMIHVSMHAVFNFNFDIQAVIRDIPQRPFITVGFLSWITMLPLAITSTKGWIRRLGGRRWRALHRLVYVSGIAGTIHYFWNYKVAEPGPLLYILILLVLLGYRLLGRLRGPAPPAPAS